MRGSLKMSEESDRHAQYGSFAWTPDLRISTKGGGGGEEVKAFNWELKLILQPLLG